MDGDHDDINRTPCLLCTSEEDRRKEMTDKQLTEHFLYHVQKNCNVHTVNYNYTKDPNAPTFYICDYCAKRKVVLKNSDRAYIETDGKLRCSNCGGSELKQYSYTEKIYLCPTLFLSKKTYNGV